ncbi:MAG: Gfo/Idh/MocA family protein, partial [Candidatus Dormibacteria bacterium]
WHLTRQTVAFTRRVGAGLLTHIGLDSIDAGDDPANMARLIHRCLRGGAPAAEPRVLGVGLVGYGAIAREHANSVTSVEGLALRGVSDLSADRRTQAESDLGMAAFATAADLLADSAIDVVVLGTPPDSHADLCLQAVSAGKHVVSEKPLALRTADADRMIAAARASRRVLTTYQNRRWDPDFVALRQAIASGAIGEPFYLEMFVGGFGHPCPYWHSHEAVSGGTLFDWGSHYIDWILELIDAPIASVRAQAHKRVWHDVSNHDQVRVDLTFGDGRQAMFLHSDVAAALKPKWYVLGTAGSLVGEWRTEVLQSRGLTGELLEDRLAPADAGAALRLVRPNGFGATHEEAIALAPRRPHGFYRNLADHLHWDEPLEVPAEQGRRSLAVMEAATTSLAEGGAPVTTDL